MKTGALLLVLVMAASTVFAQKHPVKVGFDVGNDEELSRKIMNKVGVQIAARQCALGLCDTGAQYTPPARTERLDILVTITCVRDFCASNLDYWPIRDLGLHATLGSCIAEGSETELTQKIVDHFMQNTSDEQLAFASRRFKTLLNRAISMFPQGVK
jgi:hypothetical protein